MAKKFLRRVWSRYSKLGKRRKKKQVWRKPTGRDNKMREKRKGYPSVVSIGYQKDKRLRYSLEEKTPLLIQNVRGLEKIKKNQIAIIGRVGKKKKIEIAKKAKQMNLKLHNLNSESFLKKAKKKKVKKGSEQVQASSSENGERKKEKLKKKSGEKKETAPKEDKR